jgi:hypothetical protein
MCKTHPHLVRTKSLETMATRRSRSKNVPKHHRRRRKKEEEEEEEEKVKDKEEEDPLPYYKTGAKSQHISPLVPPILVS